MVRETQDGSITQMNLTTLQAFRHDLYQCFERAADARFPETQAQLSLSPFFQRHWSSLYEAFEGGRITTSRLQQLFAASIPLPSPGKPLVLGLDESLIARPQSPTAANRTQVYVPNLPKGSKPVTTGWQFSALVVLPESPSSWD